MIQENTLIKSKHHDKPILLDYTFSSTGSNKPLILFVHGFKGFKDWGTFNLHAKNFANQGFIFAKMNFSHNGTTAKNLLDFDDLEAFGQNNFSKELDDVEEVIDFFTSSTSPIPPHEIDLNQIYLIGHSRGGSIAILKSAEDSRIKKTVAWAPIEDFEKRWSPEFIIEWQKKGVQYIANARTGQQMPLYYQLYEDTITNRERLNISAAAEKIQEQLLIIHGAEDETLPVAGSKALKANASAITLKIIDGTNHVFGGSHPFDGTTLPPASEELFQETLAFLKA